MTTLQAEKRRMRNALRDAGRALPDGYIAKASEIIAAHVINLPEYQNAKTIFCFASLPREVSTYGLLAHALQSGRRICTPACVCSGEMELRQLDALSRLSSGAFGIPEPPANAKRLRPSEIDLAVIPCLSCDYSGNRLGKGGGYYDRFLAEYQGSALLVCLDLLVREGIPMEPHDRAVPVVVTERGVYRDGTVTA